MRERRFRGGRPASQPTDRTAIVVDGGLAIGATMPAAIQAIRQPRPSWVIAAMLVGPIDSCTALAPVVDEIVCLCRPGPFLALGL